MTRPTPATFPGLNFSRAELASSIARAHARGCNVLVAINTFPRAGDVDLWHRAIADAEAAGADAVILADLGLLAHAREKHPDLRLHLSVQAAAANPDAIQFYVKQFGVERVVLPRVVTVEEIAAIHREITCETEVFVFGGLCVMAEGRCLLSSYATGKSPNMHGACSPAGCISYREEGSTFVSRLGEFTINRVAKGEPAAYPTLCKGRFVIDGKATHVFEDPASLDASQLLPGLKAAGVKALKIEGRQRSRAYADAVVKAFRAGGRLARPRPGDPRRRARGPHRGRRHHRRRLPQDVALRAPLMSTNTMKLSLGPVLFNWPNDIWSDFYARVADEMPVERVYIGEVVCSKREPFREQAMGEAVERLQRAGKEVVLSTLALVTLPRERHRVVATAEDWTGLSRPTTSPRSRRWPAGRSRSGRWSMSTMKARCARSPATAPRPCACRRNCR